MYKAILLTLIVALLAVAPACADWDLAGDMTTNANPNGAWTYGTIDTMVLGYTFTPCDDNYYADGGQTVRHGMLSSTSTLPLQLVNIGTTQLHGFVDPGKYYCHGGDGSATQPYFVAARWTAPAAGNYQVSLTFSPVDALGMPALVACYLFADGVNYLAEPLSFGQAPIVFNGTFSLNAGETIDMACGPGAVAAQWTQVSEHITTVVPEPSSILAMLCGLGGFAGLLRRRA